MPAVSSADTGETASSVPGGQDDSGPDQATLRMPRQPGRYRQQRWILRV